MMELVASGAGDKLVSAAQGAPLAEEDQRLSFRDKPYNSCPDCAELNRQEMRRQKCIEFFCDLIMLRIFTASCVAAKPAMK